MQFNKLPYSSFFQKQHVCPFNGCDFKSDGRTKYDSHQLYSHFCTFCKKYFQFLSQHECNEPRNYPKPSKLEMNVSYIISPYINDEW